MITLFPHDLVLIVIGISVGVTLLRIGQGRAVLPRMPKIVKDKGEHPLDNDLLRCQYDEAEEQALREGRIGTGV